MLWHAQALLVTRHLSLVTLIAPAMLNEIIGRAAAAAQERPAERASLAAEQRAETRANRRRRANRQQHIARRVAAPHRVITCAGNATVTVRGAVRGYPIVGTAIIACPVIARAVIRVAVIS